MDTVTKDSVLKLFSSFQAFPCPTVYIVPSQFVRRMLRHVFAYLRGTSWEEQQVTAVMALLEEIVICPGDDVNNTPLGLKMHICEIILEELAKVGGKRLKHRVILAVLKPYFKVTTQTP